MAATVPPNDSQVVGAEENNQLRPLPLAAVAGDDPL